ncbi:iron-containing alcohol dehydrogenase [Propionivibrio dicarboxylicus]|uniref:NADP-dependent alcohol dehydrogenase n=1 Tax=Propionivibrio dicarboxylicus TaxID=83767 RepID=A0A1G7ZFI5_9RHOO|nr:iron-containing alcohol dehydrogenase [Propionivibrio dicarboxylicus]SDH07385.1 NADP-dependent alcohol dehydrogenase [Propionivibrio dicarboxylicus]
MQNFDFFNPTRIVFGAGRTGELDGLIPAEARVLVLFGGGSVRQNGTLDEVKAALGARHVVEFGGIEPNPTFETLMRAVAVIAVEKLDFLLAVGGGSVLDGTKFVAAAACFDGNPRDILAKFGRNVEQALPIGTVLTLPATGSEMNNGGVITIKAEGAKLPFSSPAVFPRFSLLDPTRTNSLPERQLANGVVDAYVHVMEQYLTTCAGAHVQDRFSEGLLLTLIEHGPAAVKSSDYQARANLMWTATLALNGLIGAGVAQDWSTHMIGHELTVKFDIDHARTLAVVLPAMMQVRREAKRDKLLQYADRVWGVTAGSDDERIDAAIARTRAFFESLGLPTRLSAYGIGADAIPAIVAQLEAHGMVKLGESREVTPTVSRQVLEAAL